jgi:anti-sigma regulatory factor (Ser/Thr protein kinase)
LCTSEIAANAIRHSDFARLGGTISVRTRVRYDLQLRIEVQDDGGDWTARPATRTGRAAWTSPPGSNAPSGRQSASRVCRLADILGEPPVGLAAASEPHFA